MTIVRSSMTVGRKVLWGLIVVVLPDLGERYLSTQPYPE